MGWKLKWRDCGAVDDNEFAFSCGGWGCRARFLYLPGPGLPWTFGLSWSRRLSSGGWCLDTELRNSEIVKLFIWLSFSNNLTFSIISFRSGWKAHHVHSYHDCDPHQVSNLVLMLMLTLEFKIHLPWDQCLRKHTSISEVSLVEALKLRFRSHWLILNVYNAISKLGTSTRKVLYTIRPSIQESRACMFKPNFDPDHPMQLWSNHRYVIYVVNLQ